MYHPSQPLGPPPNYTVRRLFALTVLVLALWVLYLVVRTLFGDDGGGETLQAGTTSTSTSTTAPALEEPPPCEYLDEPAIYDRPEDWHRTIVDPVYVLPDQYEPPDLVSASEANYSAEYRVRALMVEDLDRMRSAILESGLQEVALIAAYRSVEAQADLFARREAELGFDAAAEGTARPGHSEHQLGTTIDVRLIGETDVDQSFGDTPTGRWLADHAHEYGFVLSYPEGEESVTCYKYEPWHFRYVGTELAGRIQDSGLTLREYLWHWEVTGSEPGTSPSAVTSSTSSTSPTAPDDE